MERGCYHLARISFDKEAGFSSKTCMVVSEKASLVVGTLLVQVVSVQTSKKGLSKVPDVPAAGSRSAKAFLFSTKLIGVFLQVCRGVAEHLVCLFFQFELIPYIS